MEQDKPFRDRRNAGKLLAKKLRSLSLEEPLVVALPRGGVPVGYEIAKALKAPLTVLVTRKLGAPYQKELAVGAIAEGGIVVKDNRTLAYLGITDSDLSKILDAEEDELARRVQIYRSGSLPSLTDRTVVLADDGLATGLTAKAAILSINQKRPKLLILAVPVGVSETIDRLKPFVNDIVCLKTPANLQSVGMWYRDFAQVSDKEVLRLLTRKTRA